MIDYQKYWLGGMGLHEKQLRNIEKIIAEKNVRTIVEFGSGASTRFLVDLRDKKNLEYAIFSFDHCADYCYKGKHDFLDLKVRNLIRCSDGSFNAMFKTKTYIKNNFFNCQDQKHNFRVRNAFYDIEKEDLPDNIELVILDGPNGNGRSISFLHLKDKLADECYLMMDDENHHDYLERCKEIFDVEVLKQETDAAVHPLFSYAVIRFKKI